MPERARTPAPTVNGPLRTSQAPSTASTWPSNGIVWMALNRLLLDLAVEVIGQVRPREHDAVAGVDDHPVGGGLAGRVQDDRLVCRHGRAADPERAELHALDITKAADADVHPAARGLLCPHVHEGALDPDVARCMDPGLRRRQLGCAPQLQRAERRRRDVGDPPAMRLACLQRDGDETGAVEHLQALERLLERDGVAGAPAQLRVGHHSQPLDRVEAEDALVLGEPGPRGDDCRRPAGLLGQEPAGTHQRRRRSVAVPRRLRVQGTSGRELRGGRPGNRSGPHEVAQGAV